MSHQAYEDECMRKARSFSAQHDIPLRVLEGPGHRRIQVCRPDWWPAGVGDERQVFDEWGDALEAVEVYVYGHGLPMTVECLRTRIKELEAALARAEGGRPT